jgi:hypothetical protein
MFELIKRLALIVKCKFCFLDVNNMLYLAVYIFFKCSFMDVVMINSLNAVCFTIYS